MSRYFAGVDWASRTHAVCIVDERGAIAEQFEVTHNAARLTWLRVIWRAWTDRKSYDPQLHRGALAMG